jgi:hypothetical protein
MSRVKARSDDTDPEAERVQIALLRKAGPARRAQMALSLSEDLIGLARLAIRRACPELTEEDVGVRLVERQHGRELAERLRQHLDSRRP